MKLYRITYGYRSIVRFAETLKEAKSIKRELNKHLVGDDTVANYLGFIDIEKVELSAKEIIKCLHCGDILAGYTRRIARRRKNVMKSSEKLDLDDLIDNYKYAMVPMKPDE